MRCYLVDYGDDSFLVKANNKKEAKEKIWNEYYAEQAIEDKKNGYEPPRKSYLEVDLIENLFTRYNSDIVQIN